MITKSKISNLCKIQTTHLLYLCLLHTKVVHLLSETYSKWNYNPIQNSSAPDLVIHCKLSRYKDKNSKNIVSQANRMWILRHLIKWLISKAISKTECRWISAPIARKYPISELIFRIPCGSFAGSVKRAQVNMVGKVKHCKCKKNGFNIVCSLGYHRSPSFKLSHMRYRKTKIKRGDCMLSLAFINLFLFFLGACARVPGGVRREGEIYIQNI